MKAEPELAKTELPHKDTTKDEGGKLSAYCREEFKCTQNSSLPVSLQCWQNVFTYSLTGA
jgi:hypothetical protein